MSASMQGRRLSDSVDHIGDAEPGDYWFYEGGPGEGRVLWIRDPMGMFGRCAKHEVTENDDGTVTVRPSILDGGRGEFHGWLTDGRWTW